MLRFFFKNIIYNTDIHETYCSVAEQHLPYPSHRMDSHHWIFKMFQVFQVINNITNILLCICVCMSVEVCASVHTAVNACESQRNVGVPLWRLSTLLFEIRSLTEHTVYLSIWLIFHTCEHTWPPGTPLKPQQWQVALQWTDCKPFLPLPSSLYPCGLSHTSCTATLLHSPPFFLSSQQSYSSGLAPSSLYWGKPEHPVASMFLEMRVTQDTSTDGGMMDQS